MHREWDVGHLGRTAHRPLHRRSSAGSGLPVRGHHEPAPERLPPVGHRSHGHRSAGSRLVGGGAAAEHQGHLRGDADQPTRPGRGPGGRGALRPGAPPLVHHRQHLRQSGELPPGRARLRPVRGELYEVHERAQRHRGRLDSGLGGPRPASQAHSRPPGRDPGPRLVLPAGAGSQDAGAQGRASERQCHGDRPGSWRRIPRCRGCTTRASSPMLSTSVRLGSSTASAECSPSS